MTAKPYVGAAGKLDEIARVHPLPDDQLRAAHRFVKRSVAEDAGQTEILEMLGLHEIASEANVKELPPTTLKGNTVTKIEIDLAELGLAEEHGGQKLRDLVVRAAASRLLNEDDYADLSARVRDALDDIKEKIQTETRTKLTAMVTEVLEGPIEETTRWGEPKRTTTVKEIIRETAEAYLNGPGRSNRDYGNRDPQNMKELIQDTVRGYLTTELKREVDKARAAVAETVTEAALREAVKIIEANRTKVLH